jgi:DNA-binding XRE family transcriptional regulator
MFNFAVGRLSLRVAVDAAHLRLTKERTLGQHAAMTENHFRPPNQPPLDELVRLRQAKYPDMTQADFAQQLGITRLHVLSIERGRRRPSMELILRWMDLLAPEARLDMFGDLPVIERRMRMLGRLQQVSLRNFQAA